MSKTYNAFKKLDERNKPDQFDSEIFCRFTDSVEGPERKRSDWPWWAFWGLYGGFVAFLAYHGGKYLGVF